MSKKKLITIRPKMDVRSRKNTSSEDAFKPLFFLSFLSTYTLLVSCLCTNWWHKKHHQRKLHRVKTILGTSRGRMQQPIVACTRAQTLTRPRPCATCIWLLQLTKDYRAKMSSNQLLLILLRTVSAHNPFGEQSRWRNQHYKNQRSSF